MLRGPGHAAPRPCWSGTPVPTKLNGWATPCDDADEAQVAVEEREGVSRGVLAALLELDPIGIDRFRGREAPEEGGLVFGGQLLAQSLVAGAHTVDGDRLAHSLHGYFLRAGDVAGEMEFGVERVRDGRSFSAREVRVHQGGEEIFRATMSFHVPEPGLAYSPATMPPVPPPEDVPLTYTDFTEALRPGEPWYGGARPVEIRYVNPPSEPEGVPVLESQKMWIRIPEPLPADPVLHGAALAYLSDATLVDHVMLPHGYRWQDGRLRGASIDHAMWFHAAARADAWLLFDQRVCYTGAARGTVLGTVYRADGQVIATCGQEGLMRWHAEA